MMKTLRRTPHPQAVIDVEIPPFEPHPWLRGGGPLPVRLSVLVPAIGKIVLQRARRDHAEERRLGADPDGRLHARRLGLRLVRGRLPGDFPARCFGRAGDRPRKSPARAGP